MQKPTYAGLRAIVLLSLCFTSWQLSAQSDMGQELTGIGVLQKGDTTILIPKCNGECPPDILNKYLFEWDLGDCSKGFGNAVRHIYTQPPSEPITLRAAAIYDEDEDPERIQIVISDPKIVPLPAKTFQMRAEFSRPPVPADFVDIAIHLDQNFATGDLTGNLTVSEPSDFLDISIPDTSRIGECGKLSLEGITTKRKIVRLDSLVNLAEGPTTLTFRYKIPAGLEVGEDTISITVRFEGTGDGAAIDTTILLKEVVKGSHDPNTKVADPPEWFIPGQFITYTIYFQNIGTGPAKKVVISDFLDSLFDINSVKVLATEIAGKPKKFKVKIVDRQLIFSFESEKKLAGGSKPAVLAPSSVSIPKSQGLVRFRVRTLDTIGCFDHIANAAAIVFDQNPAFVTRCVVHKRFCNCQEYCNYLGRNHPDLGDPVEEDSLDPNQGNVPVMRSGFGNQLEKVSPQPFEEQKGVSGPEPPMQETEDGIPYRTLLIIAAALILLLLVLYALK